MGYDVDYQAISDDSPLLKLISASAAVSPGEGLAWEISRAIAQRGIVPRPEEQTLMYCPMIKDLIDACPGIELRRYEHSNRCYDCWNWLLSAQRRSDERIISDGDFGSKIVNGWTQLSNFQSVFGYSDWVGWTNRFETKLVAKHLSKFDEGTLKQHYDPEAMSKSVYKLNEWQYIWEGFIELREFYEIVAAHDEGVLVTFWG